MRKLIAMPIVIVLAAAVPVFAQHGTTDVRAASNTVIASTVTNFDFNPQPDPPALPYLLSDTVVDNIGSTTTLPNTGTQNFRAIRSTSRGFPS